MGPPTLANVRINPSRSARRTYTFQTTAKRLPQPRTEAVSDVCRQTPTVGTVTARTDGLLDGLARRPFLDALRPAI